MKNLCIAGMILFSLTMVSCKKCKTCTTTTYQDYGGNTPQSSTTTEEYCGKNYDDAPSEGTVNQSMGGIEQSVVTTCTEN